MAVANYHDVNGQYPPAYIANEDGTPMHSWRVLILPYLEQRALYDRYDFSKPWNSKANAKLASEMPAVYAFHGEYRTGLVKTNYLAVVGENTAWPGSAARTSDEITDDPASTILLVENTDADIHWMEPRDLRLDSMPFRINHPQGVRSKYLAPAVVMLDGTLRRLANELPDNVFRALLTANGGERIAASGDSWQLLPDGRSRVERKPDAKPQH